MTITLTREEAQQVLYTLETLNKDGWILADFEDDVYKAIETLRARLAQPEPEPVADKYLMEVECTKCGAKQDGVLTVTAPQQRNWQGLTDEEIKRVIRAGEYDTMEEFACAIEAKLKGKNK